MKLVLNTAPSADPVSLPEAKNHLRVDTNDEDRLIRAYIKAAVNAVETEANRQLITATWDQHLDAFPGTGGTIELLKPPVQSVTSITYTDTDGNTQTFSSSKYVLSAPDNGHAIIHLAANENWPTDEIDEVDAVKITYKAGYGDSAGDVPDSIRIAILMLVSDLNDMRSAASEIRLSQNPAAQRILRSELIPIA